MRVVVFGTRKLGYEGIKKLIESGHQVVRVVTKQYDITEGYGNWEFAKLCTENNIPIYVGEKVPPEVIEGIKEANPDIGLSLYWKRLLGEDIVGIPRYGFLNIHAGPLPQYRGFAASVWQMLEGEKIGGCVIHQVVPGEADSGDIVATVTYPIGKATTIKELNDNLFQRALDILPDVLDGIKNGGIDGIPQLEAMAVHSYPRLPQDGEIDWKTSACGIDLRVRALTHPYPGAFTYIQSQSGVASDNDVEKLYIWKAHIVIPGHKFVGVPGHVIKNDKEIGESHVLTGKGILALEQVQIGEGEPFAPGRVWKSVQIRLGLDMGRHIMQLQERIRMLEADLGQKLR